jgi:serine/threonine protein kinase
MTSNHIGNYELLDRIGEGGMGEVWRARHKTLDRLVAIKLVRPGALGGSAEQDRVVLRRFEREARTAAALRSPHAIQIHDFGTAADGTFFQVMELLHGFDLQALVKLEGPLPPERMVALIRQACDALAEAHSLGFIHRDVKPSNLFLCRLGPKVDFLKVLDFGLARRAQGQDAQDSLLTQRGSVPGSPAFLAPELIRGLDAPTDRADVYALGCVAFFLLCGRLVFEGRAPIEIIVGHLEKEPPLLAEVAPQVVRPDLEELVVSCLAKAPENRPSIRELSRALASLGLDKEWTEERAELWWEEHGPVEKPLPSTLLASPAEEAPMRSDEAASTYAPRAEPSRPPPSLSVMKEQAYDALKESFEKSRIDLFDFERRLVVARKAETTEAVQDAMQGLPWPLPEPAQPLVPVGGALPATRAEPGTALAPASAGAWRTVAAVFGGNARKGAWKPDRRIQVISVFGGNELDFRLARLEPGVTEVRCFSTFGGTTIIVPPELYVEVDGIGIFGGFSQTGNTKAEAPEDRPWLHITGVAFFGGVDVRVRPRPGEGPSFGDFAEAGAQAIQQVAERLTEVGTRMTERARARAERREMRRIRRKGEPEA